MHQVKGRLKSAGESFKVLMKKSLMGDYNVQPVFVRLFYRLSFS